MKRLYQTCISALIFLIPSNLFYVLSEYGSRIHGLQIDYLLPKLHASDLCIAALVCLWLFEHRKQSIVPFFKDFFTSKKAVVLLVLVVGITARQLSTTHPLQAVFAFVSWTKLALLGYILWQKRAVVHSLATYATLAVTVLFQSLVAVWQFSTQQSIAGYWFLGETNLSSFAGLAKTAWGGAEQVLPYGTTAHPNVLAGFLALSSGVLLWRTLNSKFSTHQVLVLPCCYFLYSLFSNTCNIRLQYKPSLQEYCW